MKKLSEGIYGKLSGSTFASDIGNRFYKSQAPDGTQYPYAVYMMPTDIPEYTFSEQYERVMVQFSIFSSASSSSEIEDALTHLKSLYDDCALSVTGYTTVWMRRTGGTLPMKEDHTTTSGTQSVWAAHVEYEVYLSKD